MLVNASSAGDFDMGMRFMGEGFIILSTVSFSLSNNLTKHYSKTENPVMLCGWQFILGGAVLIVSALVSGGRINFNGVSGVLIILYLSMVSAVAFSLTSLLMKYNPVSRVSIYAFLNPVFGVLLSILILGESGQSFGLRGLLALFLVCAGVFTVNYSKTNASS